MNPTVFINRRPVDYAIHPVSYEEMRRLQDHPVYSKIVGFPTVFLASDPKVMWPKTHHMFGDVLVGAWLPAR